MDKTYIAYYRSYFYDQDDRCVQLSREEYEKLLPYEHELRNSNSITQELSNFVWDTLYSKNDFNLDVFEEMDDDKLEVIEIAVC